MVLKGTLARISNMTTPTNEQATITQIIVPVLIDLGWNVDTISREHWVGGRKEGGKVDIALMKGNRCVCIVEAKRPGVNLMDHVDQVLRYAFYEGVTFCVLTDGLEWRFYLPREEGRPEEREFAVLRLKDNPIEQSENDLRRFLSREAILSGAAERDAVRKLNELQIDRELPDIWRKMLSEPDQELVTWVGRRVSEKHGFSPSADQVAKVVVATAAPSQPTYSNNPNYRTKPAGSRVGYPTGYALFGVYKPWRSGIGMWVDVVEQVYSRHEHDFLEMTKEHLRLWPRSNRVLISECPLDTSGRPLTDRDWRKQWRKIKYMNYPEIFVYKDMKIVWFIEVARKLLELFGYPASDLEIHEGADRHLTDSSADKSGVKHGRKRGILGATVLGVYKELHSGKAMWKYVVEQVHARHPQDFLEKAAQLRGTKREFVSGSYQNKNRPERVGDTEVFVETDMTIDEFEKRSRQLLELFGYPDSALQIHER